MSVSCQMQTHALQQMMFLLNDLVGAGEQRWRQFKANRFGRP
jgi:hypothetical protein